MISRSPGIQSGVGRSVSVTVWVSVAVSVLVTVSVSVAVAVSDFVAVGRLVAVELSVGPDAPEPPPQPARPSAATVARNERRCIFRDTIANLLGFSGGTLQIPTAVAVNRDAAEQIQKIPQNDRETGRDPATPRLDGVSTDFWEFQKFSDFQEFSATRTCIMRSRVGLQI